MKHDSRLACGGMIGKRKIKQKLVYIDGIPSPDDIGPGESGINAAIVSQLKVDPIFKRKKWPRILDLLIENHFNDGTIADSQSIAKWADVNYNTVWRAKNYLLERQLLVLINRNGLIGFNPAFVLVKGLDGQTIEPRLQTRF